METTAPLREGGRDIDGFRCLHCDANFRKPSFSEGPKTVNPDTGVEDVRFKLSKCLCPECLSDHIRPTLGGKDVAP
jgi:hypothetical protein